MNSDFVVWPANRCPSAGGMEAEGRKWGHWGGVAVYAINFGVRRPYS